MTSSNYAGSLAMRDALGKYTEVGDHVAFIYDNILHKGKVMKICRNSVWVKPSIIHKEVLYVFPHRFIKVEE